MKEHNDELLDKLQAWWPNRSREELAAAAAAYQPIPGLELEKVLLAIQELDAGKGRSFQEVLAARRAGEGKAPLREA